MESLNSQISARWRRALPWLRVQLKTRLVPFAFIAALTVQVDSCGHEREYGLDEQEFLCDEAAARLAQCCGHRAGLYCTREYGCHHRAPDLSEETGLCIREQSCEALISAGACAISEWKPSDSSSATGASSATTESVLKALRCL